MLGLFPDRTASLPGGPLRRQLCAAEPRPDRSGILLRSSLERVLDAPTAFDDREKARANFERLPDISSPGMLSTTENVCLGDASIGVARNPLRDGAPPTGHSLLTLRMFCPCARRRGPRSPSPCFIDRLVRDDRPGSRRVPRSFRRAPPRSYCGHRLRHSSKRCSPLIKDDWIETVVSPRAVFRGDLHAFLPSKIDRGACVAPWRARRTSIQAEVEKSISHGAPSASAVRLFFSLTSCHSGPETRSKIRGPGSAKSRLDGRMVTRERCLSSIEPEASSETGSFRRRAPVAASSSVDSGRKRLE